ncbi:hypothetical protein F9U64_18925 [Gracilibacillus oryzae]|uniref:Uncharacterized protein n=1 Tax=Gracilibacillus oryzae TaxID=1672701 RepID=A0A7C8GRQ8_9BACI|nr:hypothetical protein [Gracilibacillus oryzae]KAB8126895.1 hypothetical protein F9U64_18925 [Gracilibacillus oryzae]
MTYQPTEWKNRVTDSEGNILQEGTPIHADNMNKIEGELTRLSEESENISQHSNQLVSIGEELENHELRISSNKESVDGHELRITSTEDTLTAHNNKLLDLEGDIQGLNNEKGQPNGIATLNSSGIIHGSQLPTNLKEIKIAADITARDALDKFEGLRVMVIDASADSTVNSGWAEYVYDGTNFIKTSEAEGVDLVIDWSDVVNKPSKYPPQTHSHTESDIEDLDKYTKEEVENKLSGKSNTGHKHVEDDITDLDKYTKEQVDTKLRGKSNTGHTHTESDITDLDKYTKNEIDTLLSTHTHNFIPGEDTRDVDYTPLEYMEMSEVSTSLQVEFKRTSIIHVDDFVSGTYCFLETYTPWKDGSGGYPRQIVYGTNGILYRVGTSNAEWGNWRKISYFSGSYNHLTNVPANFPPSQHDHYPTDILQNSTHRFVTDAEKLKWNNKSEFSGKYSELTGKPTIPHNTSDLANDSNFISSNAGKIHVSYSESDIPSVSPNDIVFKVI